ncbi:uncharacterized protein KIAA1143 homolog [Topomyia yanbarensis]|uniref:uncharacterized protein KIAA1143 homolog n=1 Tax=Topomyia yanbarensis TaxID=2498891 RepID=UPI00273BA290|nr:uncharacterized protein KIAA1143 homolog [Topomyia yanbarensis]
MGEKYALFGNFSGRVYHLIAKCIYLTVVVCYSYSVQYAIIVCLPATITEQHLIAIQLFFTIFNTILNFGTMSKRNVAFIKPEEPDFLKRMKAQIGYREGPSVDTKRQQIQNLEDSDDEDREDREDEKPQVVVLKNGDLTAEEAADAEKEEAEKPADLNQKVVFKSKKSKVGGSLDDKQILDRKTKKRKQKAAKSKLSFGDDDENEDDT